ncbi:PRC-barrel domain-containing protein [Roseovarius sp. S4756]|uniref:PRC-barrel domain-containing protein n=1 Tax=Roseovarius maritimus TaxID=3342637 RepID=UPI0037272316
MTLKTLMMTAAASALIAGGAIAQDTATTEADTAVGTEMSADAPAATPAFTSIEEMTVGDIVGQNVYEPNGDTIGDIDYVVGAGDSADAVIGIGGFLGLGEYTVALPLSDFTYDADQQMIKLDTTKDALKELPEFDESNAESLPDETPLADLMASNDSADPAATTGDAATSSDSMSSDSMSGDAATTDDAASSDAATDISTEETDSSMSSESDAPDADTAEGADTEATTEGNAEAEATTEGAADAELTTESEVEAEEQKTE